MGDRNNLLWLSIPLALLLIIVSLTGLYSTGFYAKESLNWQAQSAGQDMADLFLVTPALLITAILAARKRKGALLAWAGVVMYIVYSFIIFCFAVHFNRLFLFYCAILGLSFYSLAWFFYTLLITPVSKTQFNEVPRKTTGIYFIILAILFAFLWLSEIIPAIIANDVPESVREAGLFTNAVHVIDLSVILPGMLISGILLLKKRYIGYIMAPVFLSFFILMDITIGGLVVVMIKRGLPGSYILTIIMGALTLFSSILLIYYIKKIKTGHEL